MTLAIERIFAVILHLFIREGTEYRLQNMQKADSAGFCSSNIHFSRDEWIIWNMDDEILNLRYYIKKIDPQNYGFKKKNTSNSIIYLTWKFMYIILCGSNNSKKLQRRG